MSVQMSDTDLSKFKKLGTEQLRKAVAKIQMAVTGEDEDATNWEAYDRGGLFDILKFRWPQLQAKTGATVEDGDDSDELIVVDGDPPYEVAAEADEPATEDDVAVRIDIPGLVEVKVKKAKAPFRVNQLVTYTSDEHGTWESKVTASYQVAGEWRFDLEAVREGEGFANVPASQLTARKQPVRRKPEGEPRKRKISDDIIRQIRSKRELEVLSYAKLAAWLLDTHAIKVTGDLVRSIIVGEIYSDVV